MGNRATTNKAGRLGPRTAWLALAVMATWLAVPPASAAATVVAGACVLDVTLDATSAVDVEPAQPTWTVNGTGKCVVSGHLDLLTGRLGGSLTGAHATSAGCAAGAYLGTLEFSVDGGLPAVDSTVVIAAMAGPVLQITMVTVPTFAGSGVFAQTTTDDLLACPLGTNDVTEWTGVFAFGDPATS